METYDSDPVASLTEALAPLVAGSLSSWEEILDCLPLPPEVRELLRQNDTRAMDDLVKHLVEFRTLEQ